MSSKIYERRNVTGDPFMQSGVHSSLDTILSQAASGEVEAATKVLGYLTSSLQDLRQIMEKAIHTCTNNHLWRNMLTYYALREWGEWDPFGDVCSAHSRQLPWKEMQPGAAAQAISRLFVIDTDEAEGKRKTILLRRGLDGPKPIREAAACLLGLRGFPDVIPILEDIIISDSEQKQALREFWQLRAVEALAALGDERCGPALLCALTTGQGPLHQAAARALREIGPAGESVLLLALVHPDSHIRWHAARGLGQVGSLNGIEILVEGLHDEHPSVRWATADVLANLDSPAIPYILRVLIRYPLDQRYREAVIHALHGMNSKAAKDYLRPLLAALRDPTAAYEAPLIAQQMLSEWKSVSELSK